MTNKIVFVLGRNALLKGVTRVSLTQGTVDWLDAGGSTQIVGFDREQFTRSDIALCTDELEVKFEALRKLQISKFEAAISNYKNLKLKIKKGENYELSI